MKWFIKLTFLLCSLCLLNACSIFPERSYSDIMNEEDPVYVPDRDFNLAVGDTGPTYRTLEEEVARTPAAVGEKSDLVSQEVREKYDLQRELTSLEQRQPPIFQDMYWQYKDKFRNDSERIYFLSLPSLKEREQYLQSRAMKSDSQPKYLSDLLSKEDHSEILTGMSAVQVRRIHGNPSYIENTTRTIATADGVEQNQSRWAYKLPRNRVRYIYFDQDQVKGWSEEVSP